MKENSIRRAVREGRAALGTGLKEFASRGVPWIIEAAGFDYCAIDHEHGRSRHGNNRESGKLVPGH